MASADYLSSRDGTESPLLNIDPEDVGPPDSVSMSAEEYNPHCTTEVRMVVCDLEMASPVPAEDDHDPRATEGFRRLGTHREIEIQDWVQNVASAQFPCKECEIIESSLPSEETLGFWRGVELTSDLDTRCHVKFYKSLIQKLKETFPNEMGFKNTRTMNVLRKLLLRSDSTDETERVKLESVARVVRFFGPIKMQNNRCVLIQEVHNITEKSLQYKDKSKKEKVSWFAGDMKREEAEERLRGQPEYTYLIRMSQSNGNEGDFALSVVLGTFVCHFEIKGQPMRALTTDPHSACLLFNDKEYRNLPELVEDIKFNSFVSQEDGQRVWCRSICPGLPFNALMSGYKRAGRQK